jgi:hypothetical protein
MRKSFAAIICLACCSLLVAQQSPAPAPSNTNPDSGPVTATPPQPERPPQPHTLMDGTPVKLRLSETMTSANAKVGQEVPFEVVEDITVDGVVVLPKGSTAIGTVTDCNPKKSMGRAGKLDISISYARLADQEKVALRAVQDNKGGGHVGAMTGAIVATSIVFFPAAPLFLFIHGKDITLPQGSEITAFVEGDMHLDMAKFVVAPPVPSNAAPASEALASVIVESTPPGADIEVDGAFVGNTPSTVSVAPGSHQIAVKKNGFTDWTKTLNVTGGNVHLNAELDPAAPPVPATVPPPAKTFAPTTPPQ